MLCLLLTRFMHNSLRILKAFLLLQLVLPFAQYAPCQKLALPTVVIVVMHTTAHHYSAMVWQSSVWCLQVRKIFSQENSKDISLCFLLKTVAIQAIKWSDLSSLYCSLTRDCWNLRKKLLSLLLVWHQLCILYSIIIIYNYFLPFCHYILLNMLIFIHSCNVTLLLHYHFHCHYCFQFFMILIVTVSLS